VAAVIVGVGAARPVGLSACRWRRWHRDAARAMPLLREPCPRSTEWRGPPLLNAWQLSTEQEAGGSSASACDTSERSVDCPQALWPGPIVRTSG
jgi:hypothetical protein